MKIANINIDDRLIEAWEKGAKRSFDEHALALYEKDWQDAVPEDVDRIANESIAFDLLGLGMIEAEEIKDIVAGSDFLSSFYTPKSGSSAAFCGYTGETTLENFRKTSSSPLSEDEIRESFGGEQILPVSAYPEKMRPFIEKWREALPQTKVSKYAGYESVYIGISVMYLGTHYTFSVLNLGGTPAQFRERLDEMTSDLLGFEFAFRVEECF